MQQTSAVYKQEMQLPLRGKSHMRISISVIDVTAAGDATPWDNSGLYYSRTDGLVYDRVPAQTYATFEPGRWRVDGSQLVPHEKDTVEQGFVSEVQANSAGIYQTQPCVRFTFSKAHSFPALTLTFDPSCGDYPAEIQVKAYRGGAVAYDITTCPDAPVYEVIPVERQGFERVDRVDIIFTKARQAGRRARLQRVMFGYLLVFGGEQLQSASHLMEIDPITRRLPRGTLDFDVINYDGDYNPDNPYGAWRELEERMPIQVEYGLTMSRGMKWGEVYGQSWKEVNLSTWGNLYGGGYVEWIPAGWFYLNGKPSTSGYSASFGAVDLMELLDREYYKAKLQEYDLYTLAVSVLEEAEIPLLSDGSVAWQLWDGLKSIKTKAPVPILPARELMQLIAHAACCVMRVDRTGRLRIEPLDNTQLDARLDFDTMHEQPSVEKTPALGGVKVLTHSFSPEEEEGELHKGEYDVQAGETLHIQFPEAARGVYVEVDGKKAAADIYARALDITMPAGGLHEVIVYGTKLQTSTVTMHSAVADAYDHAVWEEIENILITDTVQAKRVAEWVKKYLLLRNTYEFSYRGNPEIDPLDKIWIESRFTPEMPGYVLCNRIDFNGAIGGQMMVKKVDV